MKAVVVVELPSLKCLAFGRKLVMNVVVFGEDYKLNMYYADSEHR